MDTAKLLFWNVDTQVDFVEPDGKLYVPGAEKLRLLWQQITSFAKNQNIKVLNTADYHLSNSAELSEKPDFVHTFPPHCMADTKGADYVWETRPELALVFDWDKQYLNFSNVKRFRNIVIRKDAFDVFVGNPYTDAILKEIDFQVVVVYGVTTNVCVDRAVVGLAERGKQVIVLEDAIKELPNLPLPFEHWDALGVQRMSFQQLKEQC